MPGILPKMAPPLELALLLMSIAVVLQPVEASATPKIALSPASVAYAADDVEVGDWFVVDAEVSCLEPWTLMMFQVYIKYNKNCLAPSNKSSDVWSYPSTKLGVSPPESWSTSYVFYGTSGFIGNPTIMLADPTYNAIMAGECLMSDLPMQANQTYLLARFNFTIIALPEEYENLTSPLQINNAQTYLFSSEGRIIAGPDPNITDGHYEIYWVGSPPAGNGYLVVRGLDDMIYYRTYNASGVSWESWRVVPGGATCDSPAAAVYSGRLYLVVRGMDEYSLWFGSINTTDDAFSGWTWLSGATQSAPTLANYDSKLVLTVRGLDNCIYYRFYDCDSDTWESWNTVPNGSTCDSPAAAALEGALHFVVKGADGYSIWHSSVNLTTSDFSGWELIGGATESKPTLTRFLSRNELYLVVRGLDNAIYYNVWNGVEWQGWTSMPSGATCDSPAEIVLGNELHIVVRDITGITLWHYCINLQTDAHSGWTAIDGFTPSAPTLAG